MRELKTWWKSSAEVRLHAPTPRSHEKGGGSRLEDRTAYVGAFRAIKIWLVVHRTYYPSAPKGYVASGTKQVTAHLNLYLNNTGHLIAPNFGNRPIQDRRDRDCA